jgi:hypothetical protein
MPTCPAGHESTSTDFCDNCGMRIGASPAPPVATPSAAASAGVAAAAGPPPLPAEPCPQCGTARSGQFCEACGFDFVSGTPPAAPAAASVPVSHAGNVPPPQAAAAPPGPGPLLGGGGGPSAAASGGAAAAATATSWTAIVTADRAYFDSVVAAEGPDAATLDFPGYCPERRFRLTGAEMRIGRRSVSRGLEPEIDLTGPPADPGVSHMHAVLMAQPDGGWAIVDPGSANGTRVNGNELSVGVRTPLHDGDRICLGAWTLLTIQSA